jgi:hypothetical protein
MVGAQMVSNFHIRRLFDGLVREAAVADELPR